MMPYYSTIANILQHIQKEFLKNLAQSNAVCYNKVDNNERGRFGMKIDWTVLKKQYKKHIGYNLLVLLCGLLALTFLVLTVIAMFSSPQKEGVAVKEAFTVSSAALDGTNQNFVSQLGGYLINYEDDTAEVESIIVVVGNGRDREDVEIEGVKLYPRHAEEIRCEWKTNLAFDRVHSVMVVVNGQLQPLANSTATWEFNPSIIIYAALCAICCLGTSFTFKKRYYRYQEDLIAERDIQEQ